jgi:DNA-binding transcriptional LysR family regulator
MLDLQRLRYFVTVARHEHVARAAAELHISQSPLSRQIMQLESELGLALFTREKKRLKLTKQGRALWVDAERLLESEAAFARRAQALAGGGHGSVTIGYVAGAVHAGVLPRQLALARRRAPGLRIELKPLSSAAQVAAIVSGAIDLGYAHAKAPRDSGVATRLVHEEPFMLAVPKADAAYPRSSRDLAALSQLPLIMLPESASPGARGALLAALSAVGVTASVEIEAQDPVVLLRLVSAGVGFAVLQKSLQRLAPRDARFIPLPRRFGLRLEVHMLFGQASPLTALFGGPPQKAGPLPSSSA